MKSILLLICLIFITQLVVGQCDTNRYVNPIFSSVYEHSDVKYGEAPAWNFPYFPTDLFMDIYEPVGDTLSKRPLMLWVHPGGFLLGDKEADDMVALCDSFAKRGYVTASIGYRLGFNPLSSTSAERAVYRGTQDVRAAIRYLIEYSSVYDIDTNHIFVGGSSAGALAALHVIYADQNEAPASITGNFFDPDLGCLDCTGNPYVHDVSPEGYVNLWGAIGDSSWVDVDETTPGLLIHGTADPIVPFGVGNPFGVFTTPLVHGSRSVHNQLEMHGIDHTILSFEGEGHEPHGTTNGTFITSPTPYWDTIFNAVRDHYFSIIQPDEPTILGDEIVCDTDHVWYSVAIDSNEAACWTVQNGTIIQSLSDSVQVVWSQGVGSVSARIENCLKAVSNQSILPVIINELPSNTFTYVVNGLQVAFDLSGVDIASVTWDFGDSNTGNGQMTDHSFTQEGVYEVTAIITGTNGCVNYSSQFVTISSASLGVINSESSFSIFPNPANNELNVVNVPNGADLILADALGNELLRTNVSQNKTILEIEKLSRGIYFITVDFKGAHETMRFVKK